MPEPVLVALMRRIFKSKQMADIIRHAHAARGEMKQLAKEFKMLSLSTSVSTPAMDILNTYTNMETLPVIDGSAKISMNLRSVWIGLGLLIGLIVVLILMNT
jgi:hypothetical protein